jgi:hypothetical protein
MTERSFDVVAAVNDVAILERNLGASPAITSGMASLQVEFDAPCSSVAYNHGLDVTSAAVVVFAHQDVYLPASWPQRLEKAIEQVEKIEPEWAVLGPIGIAVGGKTAGRAWCAANRGLVGEAIQAPVPVQSLDEIVLVVRRGSRLRFDESLPSFHLYGTDIVQQARSAGFGAFAVDIPVVHNSKPVTTLAGGYVAGWRYLRRKWRAQLPIATTITSIDSLGLKLVREQFWLWRSRKSRMESAFSRDEDPALIARRYGIE